MILVPVTDIINRIRSIVAKTKEIAISYEKNNSLVCCLVIFINENSLYFMNVIQKTDLQS
jgi:hypothetical protein